MSDNYTMFSFTVDDLTAVEITWITGWMEADDDAATFNMEVEDDGKGGKRLWIYAEDHGDTDAVAGFLHEFITLNRPAAALGFEFAMTASRPILGEFGGGACIVTANGEEWVNTGSWLNEKLRDFNSAEFRAKYFA